MRVLKFSVDGQKLRKDPDCDFGNLRSGSVGYLAASFSFDKTWDGLHKVVEFANPRTSETYPMLLKGNSCDIPSEVAALTLWTVQLVGKKGDVRIPTTKVYVRQEG